MAFLWCHDSTQAVKLLAGLASSAADPNDNQSAPVDSQTCVVSVLLYKRTVPVPGFVITVLISGQVKKSGAVCPAFHPATIDTQRSFLTLSRPVAAGVPA